MVGAGNIGRGVIGGLFYESGYHLYIYDIMAERMENLKKQGHYLVERVGAEEKRRVLVENFDVLDCSDARDLIEHMKKIDLVACCVYEGAFPSICENLKEAILYRAEIAAEPLNVLICANALGAPEYFEKTLAEGLKGNEAASRYLRENVGICQVLVGMAGMPSPEELLKEDPFAVTTRLDGHIGIDEEAFIGEPPVVIQTDMVKKARAQIYRKVYAGNMKHCMTAYLGKARGCTYIADTYDDAWIEENTLRAFYEAEEALQREYQFDEEDRKLWVDSIVNAKKNRNLKDPLSRVAADPKTKLCRTNRFTGAALLCMKQGILPFYLAKGIAYGLLYRDAEVPDSIEISDFIKENGIEKGIEVYCGLTEDEWELKQLIAAQYKEAESKA